MKKLLFPISLILILAACSGKEEGASPKNTDVDTARKVPVKEVSIPAAPSQNCADYTDYLANCKTFYCEEKKESDGDSSVHFKLVKAESADSCVYKAGTKTLGGSLNPTTDCLLSQTQRLQLAGYLKTKEEFGGKLKKESGTLPNGVRYDETLEDRPVPNPLYTLVEAKACSQNI